MVRPKTKPMAQPVSLGVAAGLGIAWGASPALAASGPFFSLGNTDFVVMLGFLLFIAILLYFKVPSMVLGLLDKRAATIAAQLEEARALREEAQSLLADCERRHRDVQDQSERIVAQAKAEAERMAEQARSALQEAIARRVAAAQDQIASAEASAIRQLRDQAVGVSIEAAGRILANQMTQDRAHALIDTGIALVEEKLH